MNILKIETMFLKAMYRGDRVMLCSIPGYSEKVCISDDCCIFLIPTHDYHLKVPAGQPFNAKYFIQDYEKARHAVPDLENIRRANGRTILEFRTADGDRKCFIDETYFKLFDKDAEWRIIDSRAPAYIFEDGVLAGICCGVYIKNEMEG